MKVLSMSMSSCLREFGYRNELYMEELLSVGESGDMFLYNFILSTAFFALSTYKLSFWHHDVCSTNNWKVFVAFETLSLLKVVEIISFEVERTICHLLISMSSYLTLEKLKLGIQGTKF